MSEEIIEPNSIRADTPDWQEGYGQGILQQRLHVMKLLDEVIEAYEDIYKHPYNEREADEFVVKSQINAVKFTKKWVSSGGQIDLDGNRACLPW